MSEPTLLPDDPCYQPAMLSFDQAREFLLDRARPVNAWETVDLPHALGRVLAQDERATVDVPGYDNSAMDGYAVRSSDVMAQRETCLRVAQRIAAGKTGAPLGRGEAARIFTGAPIPPGADAVVMQESCRQDGQTVRFSVPVTPGDWIRPQGNDVAAGARVLAAGARIRPQEMGLAASVGLTGLRVCRRLRVAIFSSGDELLQPGEPMRPGAIYNSNRYTLWGLLTALGCEVKDLGTVPDDMTATRATLAAAARDADVVVTSGGVSVGEEDYVKGAVEAIGRLEMWRIAVKPGKPLAYGRIEGADFLGLPGNPVSVLVTFCLLVRPFLLRRQGTTRVIPDPMVVPARFAWEKPGDRREFVRARLESGGDSPPGVELFPKQGSDVLTSATWADGLVDIPERTKVAPGDLVAYYSFADLLS